MKGMAHTPFAIFGITVLFLLFMVPLNSIPQESEIYVKGAESANADAVLLEDSFEKGIAMAASNYIEASNQYVVDNGFVSNAGSSIDFAAGEFNGSEVDFVNYTEWASGLDKSYSERGHDLDYSFENLGLETGLRINGSVDLNYNFTHDSRSTTYSVDSQRSGLEGARGPDPLLEDASGGTFTPQYNYCGFDTPATQLGTGSSSSGDIAHGYASVEPQNVASVNTTYPRILVTDNTTQYTSSLDPFTGVITEGTVPAGNYAELEGLDLNISEGTSVIINGDDAWRSHFRTIMDHQCYISNSNAPGILERMEGDFTASPQGVTTFVNDSSPTGTTNEAYIYHNSASSSPVNISGVTKGDYGNFRPYFMLSEAGDNNIAEWNIDSLVN